MYRVLGFVFTAFILFLNFKSDGQLPWGSIAPDFTLSQIPANCNPNGQWGPQYNLYSELNGGKNVIIDFSSTYCSFCWNYHQTHTLEKLYNQYGPQGNNTLNVFYIETDPNNDLQCLCGGNPCNSGTFGDWTVGTTYPIFSPNGTICEQIVNIDYEVPSMPTYYAINAQHKTVWEVEKNHSGRLTQEEWESWLNESFSMQVNVNSIISNECSTTIDITATGGKGSLSYKWSNGENTEDLTGKLNGKYFVTVTDQNGYFLVAEANVNANYNSCPCIPDINVDLSTPGNHTIADMLHAMNLSNLNQLCNSNVQYNMLLAGNLILDSGNALSVCFNNMNIAMKSDAKIILKNATKLNLNNVNIQGCDAFWDQIYVETGSTLKVTNKSVLSNAKTAIYAQKGAILYISDATFYNNKIGIYLAEKCNVINSAIKNTSISLSNSTFTADQSFDDYGSSNNSIEIYSLDQPTAGIYISGQEEVLLSSGSNTFNIFENLEDGITCTHGSVTVSNAIFKNIFTNVMTAPPGEGEDNPHPYNYILHQGGFGIKIIDCTNKSSINTCDFKDVQYAIGCSHGKINIGGNSIVNVVNGVYCYNLSNLYIDGNQIKAFSKGIELFNCTKGNINRTEISLLGNNYNSVGIVLQNTSNISVLANTIINANNAGIFLQNSTDNTIWYNFIKNGTYKEGGIVIKNSTGNIFQANEIDGNVNHPGFFVSDADVNTYECNTNILNTGIGMHFTGMCDDSKLKGNKVSSSALDLCVGDPNSYNSASDPSVIGLQGDKETKQSWGNKYPDITSKAHHSGTWNIINLSPFIVNATVDPTYKPRIIDAASQWFKDDPAVTNLDPCAGGMISNVEGNCLSLINKILKIDTLRQMNTCTKIMWQYKYFRQLIDMKKKGLLSPECLQWLNRQNLNTILQVVKISKATDSLNVVKINTVNWFNNRGARDSISRAADSLKLVIWRTVLVDSCLKVMNKVNEVRLNQVVNDTLSRYELEILRPIAISCPNEMGEGVYWSRGLLSMYADNIRYPLYEDCTISQVVPRSFDDKKIDSDKIQISPNPAADIVSISFNLFAHEYGELSIIDITGKLMFKTMVDKLHEELRIETNSYNPGIYIVKYASASGEDIIEKLVITR